MAINPTVGTRTSLTSSSLSTLASGAYCTSNAYNCDTNKPLDVIVEAVLKTTNAPASLKQATVFIKESNDGTNYRSGPESGTTTTDEPDLRFMGTVPMNTSSTDHAGTFSVRQALGYVPKYFKIVVKNELGVALTSGALYTAEVSVS